MPPIERKILVAHTTRTPQPSSGCIALFGLPFIAVGLFILSLGAGWIELSNSDLGKNRGVMMTFGAVFAVAGLLLVQQTITGKLREARRRRRLRSDPAQPWLADYPWDAGGETFRVGAQAVQILAALLFLAAFLAPFNYLFFPFPAILIFDGLLLLGVGWFVYYVVQSGKYGDSRLRYASFPFYLGSQAVLHVEGIDRLKGLRQLTITLRCIEEGLQHRPTGKGVSAQNVCSATYEDERILVPEEITFGEGGRARFLSFARREDAWTALRLEFPLPDEEEYETHLAAPPVRYWELEVKADTPGVDYSATFLVPVYRRQHNPASAAFPD
jgi:hypothetical protein